MREGGREGGEECVRETGKNVCQMGAGAKGGHRKTHSGAKIGQSTAGVCGRTKQHDNHHCNATPDTQLSHSCTDVHSASMADVRGWCLLALIVVMLLDFPASNEP